MTKEELFREFQSRIQEKRDSLNKSDCPEGYAFEEYQEGWRSAFLWAEDILGKLISEQPSFPSNLDEAAWKYGIENQDGIATQSEKVAAFKAGALKDLPMWKKCEEDSSMIDETIYFINEYQKSDRCKDENGMQNSVTCENWLKSLKERMKGE